MVNQQVSVSLDVSQKPKASLLAYSVTSSHLFSLLTPKSQYEDQAFLRKSLRRELFPKLKMKDLSDDQEDDLQKAVNEKLGSISYNLDDYKLREEFLNQYPFAKLLLDKGLKPRSLVSMIKCGSVDKYGSYLKRSCDCGVTYGAMRHHCSNRSCYYCSKIRQRKLFRKYYPLVRNLKPSISCNLKFLTLNPKNYDSLEEGQDHIRKSISKMIRNKYFKDKIRSGFYVIESKSSSTGWNIHAHMIIFSSYLDNRLSGYCQECKRKVKIKMDPVSKKFYCSRLKCNSLKVKWDGEDSELTQNLNKVFGRSVIPNIKYIKSYFNRKGSLQNNKHALNYCLKYVSGNKDDFKDDNDFAEYIVYTSNRRLINVFGAFYNFSNDPMNCECPKCKFILNFEVISYFNYLEELQPPE